MVNSVITLKKNPRNNKSIAFKREEPGSKEAKLTYRVLNCGERYTLLEVDLHTGRHHQIRSQLAAVGHPIKGDVKYGARRAERDKSICLHARSLAFNHPTTKASVRIEASVPETFEAFLK